MRGRRSDEGIVFFKVSGASAVGVSPLAAGCRVRVSAGGRCARPAQAPSGARGNAQLFQTGRKGTVPCARHSKQRFQCCMCQPSLLRAGTTNYCMEGAVPRPWQCSRAGVLASIDTLCRMPLELWCFAIISVCFHYILIWLLSGVLTVICLK